jgi:hypothetical protein
MGLHASSANGGRVRSGGTWKVVYRGTGEALQGECLRHAPSASGKCVTYAAWWNRRRFRQKTWHFWPKVSRSVNRVRGTDFDDYRVNGQAGSYRRPEGSYLI